MTIPLWIISQLLSYTILNWCGFVAIAFIAGRGLGIGGVVLGHFAVAVVVGVLDVYWIQSEMHKPGWNGVPDQDIVFVMGMVFRVILINATLLPLSIFAMRGASHFDKETLTVPER